MRTSVVAAAVLVLCAGLGASLPANAVVYTFGDAELSAKKVEVRLRERQALATGNPRLSMRGWRVEAKTISLRFDEARLPIAAECTGGASFSGKLTRPEAQGEAPAAETLKGHADRAEWSRDPGWGGPQREDQGVLTLSGEGRIELASVEGEMAALNAPTVVARLNQGALEASGGAALTISGGRLDANVVQLTWDRATRTAQTAQASGGVTFRYESRDTDGNIEDTYSGSCETASWRRDPDWAGPPQEDQGIAVLRGSVQAEAQAAEGGQHSRIACDTLTLNLNERVYTMEGGPEGQVDLQSGGGG